MFVKKIHFKNYRCYPGDSISLSPLTLIMGPRGSGKSTIPEAIALAMSGGTLEDRGGIRSALAAGAAKVAELVANDASEGFHVSLDLMDINSPCLPVGFKVERKDQRGRPSYSAGSCKGRSFTDPERMQAQALPPILDALWKFREIADLTGPKFMSWIGSVLTVQAQSPEILEQDGVKNAPRGTVSQWTKGQVDGLTAIAECLDHCQAKLNQERAGKKEQSAASKAQTRRLAELAELLPAEITREIERDYDAFLKTLQEARERMVRGQNLTRELKELQAQLETVDAQIQREEEASP